MEALETPVPASFQKRILTSREQAVQDTGEVETYLLNQLLTQPEFADNPQRAETVAAELASGLQNARLVRNERSAER